MQLGGGAQLRPCKECLQWIEVWEAPGCALSGAVPGLHMPNVIRTLTFQKWFREPTLTAQSGIQPSTSMGLLSRSVTKSSMLTGASKQ